MESIIKLFSFLNDNWTFIITLIGLVLGLYTKIKSYINKTREEKINIALEQIRKSMLDLVVEAEREYGTDTGVLKRSKVLKEIYNSYPVLKDYIKQEDLEKKLDEIIDVSLDKMKDMLSNNEEFYKYVYGILNK